VCFALYLLFVQWVERSDQMSFENPSLQLLFFLIYMKTNITIQAQLFGDQLCVVLLKADHLNGHARFIVLTLFQRSHFTLVCFSDDLQQRYK